MLEPIRQPTYKNVKASQPPANMSFLPGGRKLTDEEIHRSNIDFAALRAFEAFLKSLPPDPECPTCEGEGRYDEAAGACLYTGPSIVWCSCVAVIPSPFRTTYGLMMEVARDLDERDGLRRT